MISVIYFDLGGVVFRDFFSGGVDDFVKKLKIPEEKITSAYTRTDPPEYSKNKLTDDVRWDNFVKELSLPKNLAVTCKNIFYDIYQPYSESITLLKFLRAKSKFKMGVLSDQPMGVAKFLRKKYSNIFNLFDNNLILISPEIELSKKDKDLKIYDEAIKRAGTTAENILFVDNSLENITNAQKKGLKTFYFDINNRTIDDLIQHLKELID